MVYSTTFHPRPLHKGTLLVIMLTTWWIWKHRNTAVSDNGRPSVTSLFDTVKDEARSWENPGDRKSVV